MNTNDAYLNKLSKELKRHNVSELEIRQVIMQVKETLEHTNLSPIEEFGTPEAYTQALYPHRKQRQYYLFTLIGMLLAIAGFIVLNVYFRHQGNDMTLESLWKFSPLLAIPLGIIIDFTRYVKA